MRGSGAVFSECGKYRYSLSRTWDYDKDIITFCLLNPSTADANKNDPTVERCERRAKALGFGGMIVINIFALRSTNPELLYNHPDPVGEHNDRFIREAIYNSEMVVCGWGKNGALLKRGPKVLEFIKSYNVVPFVLKLNKDKSPVHPLYVSYKEIPKPIFCAK